MAGAATAGTTGAGVSCAGAFAGGSTADGGTLCGIVDGTAATVAGVCCCWTGDTSLGCVTFGGGTEEHTIKLNYYWRFHLSELE